MFKRFKSALTYKCDLPPAKVLREHLAQKTFSELTRHEAANYGFVNVPETNDLVFEFPSGIAFALRYDEKIVPAAIVTQKANEKIKEAEMEQDRRLPKKERQEIRDRVYFDLVGVALTATTIVMCYYSYKDRLLIVTKSSEKFGDMVTGALLRWNNKGYTHKIYVDSFSKGLTPKVLDFINGKYTFDKFDVCGSIKLKDENKNTFSFDVSEIELAKDGVLEAIKAGAQVKEIGLANKDMFFKINHKFVIKGIGYPDAEQETEFENELDHLIHESSVQLELFSAAHNDLIELFEYKEPENQEIIGNE